MAKNITIETSHDKNNHCSWIPFYMEFADKLLPFMTNRQRLLEIVYGLDKQYVGYIRTDAGEHEIDIDPFTVMGIFNRGITEENRIKVCDYFKEKLDIQSPLPLDFDGVPILNNQKSVFFWRERVHTDVQPLWGLFEAVLKEDERAFETYFDTALMQRGVRWNITMALFWMRPYRFISLDSRNRKFLPTRGIKVFEEKDFSTRIYIELQREVDQKLKNGEISELSIPEISYQAWKSDTLLQKRKYWLVGYTFGSSNSQFERFIKKSIWEGRFNDDTSSSRKMFDFAKRIKKGDVLIIKSSSTKGPQHNIPFLRVKAIGIVKDDVLISKVNGLDSCMCDVDYYGVKDKDFENSSLASYRKTIHLADSKALPIVNYAEQIINDKPMPQNKYAKYIELLKSCGNLVLTGAPGTGKTYMAQEIAKEMGAVTKFVQFHPSYDYTDFVEGLRPVDLGNGQIGFERKDGVFKAFCKGAITNLADSAKTLETLSRELLWHEKLELFLENAIEQNVMYKTVNGSEFFISEMREHSIVIRNENNEKTPQIFINTDEVLKLLVNEIPVNIVRDIKLYFARKHGTQSDSYTYVLVNEIRKTKEETIINADKVERKPYVFIIDEINRGEASKIFGELFYAIDPGYRGKSEVRVQTQYQNLVANTDVFGEGFYVPENVYILATMNDIDRSVESMDFAMRRRFTWKEVTPSETQEMLNCLGASLSKEAIDTMSRVNVAITETEGLGKAFMLGPSYFLKLRDYEGDFNFLWEMNIEPLLAEYLRGFRREDELLEKFKNAYYNNATSTIEDTTEELIED